MNCLTSTKYSARLARIGAGLSGVTNAYYKAEALLAVEHDVLRIRLIAGGRLDRLARQRREGGRLALRRQEAADVVVEEDRPH